MSTTQDSLLCVKHNCKIPEYTTNEVYCQNDRHLHAMWYQQQQLKVITLPTPTADTIYWPCIIQFHQLASQGSSAHNAVCNQPEVDIIWLSTQQWICYLFYLLRMLHDRIIIQWFINNNFIFFKSTLIAMKKMYRIFCND